MKYVLSLLGLASVICAFAFCALPKTEEEEYLRLHITANSNSIADQNIKYSVKEAVTEFLDQQLVSVDTSSKAKQKILSNIATLESVVSSVLRQNNANYTAKISISKENYPTRSYSGKVIEGGIYESLKIELGKAEGDNWWCCVFPSVCLI